MTDQELLAQLEGQLQEARDKLRVAEELEATAAATAAGTEKRIKFLQLQIEKAILSQDI